MRQTSGSTNPALRTSSSFSSCALIFSAQGTDVPHTVLTNSTFWHARSGDNCPWTKQKLPDRGTDYIPASRFGALRRKRGANTTPCFSFLISRREHVIFASLQDGSFDAAPQKLNEDSVLRLTHVLGRSLFDDFSPIQHGHARRDVKRAVH